MQEYFGAYCFSWLAWDPTSYDFVLRLYLLKLRTCWQFLLIFIQYMDSCANRHVFFSVTVWLLWSWSKAWCQKEVGINMLLSFGTIPSIIARLSWNVQYGCMSCLTSVLVSGHPFMVHFVSTCMCSSFCAVSHISCVDMYSGMCVYVSMVFMVNFLMEISLSLFFFAMWQLICNIKALVQTCIVCIFCISVYIGVCVEATVKVLLNLFRIWLWMVVISNYNYFTGKAVVMKFYYPCSMLSTSLSMLLYLVSALYKLLCRRPAPKPTPDASVSKYNDSFSW